MLSSRRVAEKNATNNIDTLSMTWLQQAVAMPLIIATLFVGKFYLPNELSANFWWLLLIYVILQATYLFTYFSAVNLADVSFIAPLMTLFIVGNMIGAFIILHQIPSFSGMLGAFFIMAGAWIVSKNKKHNSRKSAKNHTKAFWLIILGIAISSIFSNIEVILLRMSNPISYNFYSSVLTIPLVIVITIIVLKKQRKNMKNYWKKVKKDSLRIYSSLVIIGVTYTVNMLCTYQAKILAPNQAYVSTIKAASVIPVIIFGIIFFNEKVNFKQWTGIILMILGLCLIALNL